jgi:hypothetical protein
MPTVLSGGARRPRICRLGFSDCGGTVDSSSLRRVGRLGLGERGAGTPPSPRASFDCHRSPRCLAPVRTVRTAGSRWSETLGNRSGGGGRLSPSLRRRYPWQLDRGRRGRCQEAESDDTITASASLGWGCFDRSRWLPRANARWREWGRRAVSGASGRELRTGAISPEPGLAGWRFGGWVARIRSSRVILPNRETLRGRPGYDLVRGKMGIAGATPIGRL